MQLTKLNRNMNGDLFYQLALTQVPQIGHVQARILVQHFGSAEHIFKARISDLEKIEGIGSVRAQSIRSFRAFDEAEKELAFIEKYRIKTLFLADPAYPQRLLNCYDPPTLLFYHGKADLNASHIISVIGTRNNTEYGKLVTEKFIKELAEFQVLVVSGLAFGIDALAHKTALKNDMTTVGVLAHGLDIIYPPEHGGLARDMVKNEGGILTEFRSGTKPDKHHFPTRNRIVAGMSDAVVVVETGSKGGSMITAELANGYNKDVFAFPGKTTDVKSAGCNQLIKNNKAVLITEAGDLVSLMGWEEKAPIKKKKQKEIFIELTGPEKRIVDMLREKESLHIDQIHSLSALSNSTIAAAILNLELQQVLESLPGKVYRLLTVFFVTFGILSNWLVTKV
jgi:DNA processing protein